MHGLTWAEAQGPPMFRGLPCSGSWWAVKVILFCNLPGFLSITLIARHMSADWVTHPYILIHMYELNSLRLSTVSFPCIILLYPCLWLVTVKSYKTVKLPSNSSVSCTRDGDGSWAPLKGFFPIGCRSRKSLLICTKLKFLSCDVDYLDIILF